MQNQTISELNTDDKKTKYFGNPNDIHKSTKNFYEKLSSKIPNRKKISIEQFHLCEADEEDTANYNLFHF